MATTEAEAATGRLARQLEYERSKRVKAEAALGRNTTGGVNKGRSGGDFALPKEGDEGEEEDDEDEESDEEISGGGQTFRQFKSPGGKTHFGVHSPR